MNTIWKSSFGGAVGTGKAGVLMDTQTPYKIMQVVDKNGNVIDTLSPTSQTRGESGFKYVGSKPGSAYGQGVYLRFGNEEGKYGHIALDNPSTGYGGDINFSDLSTIGSIDSAAKFNVYNHSSVGNSNLGKYAPGQIGYGRFPANLEKEFPKAKTVKGIKTAPYNFTDPMAFAKSYGEFNRGEYAKNFEQAKGMALETLDTELQAMQHYVPAASALKREQTSIDNIFNQQQRTAQVNQALPGVNATLDAQAARAASYAQGQIPNSQQDRALELGIRSQAADRANAGGFGVASSAARKASDLMSAQQRLQIAQYGEQLTSQNIALKEQLNLAPTEYSNAGTQISVNPTVSPAQLLDKQLADINQYSMITPTTALSSVIQQQQFKTSLEDSARKFNVGVAEWNADAINNFALQKFNYKVGYANTVAGAAQIDVNTQLALQQQEIARQIAEANMKAAQKSNAITAGITAVGSGASIVSSIIKAATSGGKTDIAPGTTVEGGGKVQDDGSIDYPDGSSISKDGTVKDGSGRTQGKFETGSDGEITFIPSEGSSTTSEGTDGGETTTVETSSSEDDNTLPGSGRDQVVPPGSTIGEDNVVTDPDGNTVGEVDPSTGQFYPTTSDISNDSEIQTYAQMAGVSLPTARSLAGGSNITNAMATVKNGTLPATISPAAIKAVTKDVLANSGIYKTPVTGSEPVGVDVTGKKVYMDSALRKDNTSALAQDRVNNLYKTIAPLGVDKEVKIEDIKQISQSVTNSTRLAQLDSFAKNGDSKSFVENVNKAYSKSPNKAEELTMAISAAKLYEHWNDMSVAQKTLGLTTLALQGYKTATGKNLFNVPIPMTQIDGAKPLTVGGALDLAALGYNTTELALNWGDMSNARRIIGSAKSVSEGVRIAADMGIVSKANAASLTTGAGAVALAAQGYNIAKNWGKMNNEQRAVAATSLAQAGATLAGAPIPGVNIALAAYQEVKMIQSGYNQYYKEGTRNQKIATAAMVAKFGVGSLATLGSISMLHSMTKSGKSTDQRQRDWFRDDMKTKGLYNKDYTMDMPDGSKADVGLDGKATHDARDKNQIPPGESSKIKAYGTDYTNDLDYAAGNAGMTLTRLLYGGRDSRVDETGQQIGNAMLGTVGYGKDMTKANFDHVMTNARATYAKAGIKSKEDGFALVSAMLGQGRITNADAISMQQTLNMMYDDNGHQSATKLYEGRHLYFNSTAQLPDRDATITVGPSAVTTSSPINRFSENLFRSKQDIRAANRQQYMAA